MAEEQSFEEMQLAFLRKMNTPERRREDAYHEAGHAVAIYLTHQDDGMIAGVSIVLNLEQRGEVSHNYGPAVSEIAVIKMAGPVAEAMAMAACGEESLEDTLDSLIDEMRFCARLWEKERLAEMQQTGRYDEAEFQEVQDGLRQAEENDLSRTIWLKEAIGHIPGPEYGLKRAKELLASPPAWAAVETVAAALIERDELSGEEVTALIKRSLEEAQQNQPPDPRTPEELAADAQRLRRDYLEACGLPIEEGENE